MLTWSQLSWILLLQKQTCISAWCRWSARNLTFEFLSQQHQDEDEGAGEDAEEAEDDDLEDEDVEGFGFFLRVVRMGEENLRRFLAEARNTPGILREFMMRLL